LQWNVVGDAGKRMDDVSLGPFIAAAFSTSGR
jgi:hypothetical protein